MTADPGDAAATGSLRLDKLLWYLRFTKTRSAAQAMIAGGLIRINGRRAEKRGTAVQAGAVLTLPIGTSSRVIRVQTLPTRRGPAAEAAACIEPLNQVIESDSQANAAS